jgi:hypothetical protein
MNFTRNNRGSVCWQLEGDAPYYRARISPERCGVKNDTENML